MNDHLKTATDVPSASPFSFTTSMLPTMNRLFTFVLGVLLLAVFAVPNVHAQEDEEEDEKPMWMEVDESRQARLRSPELGGEGLDRIKIGLQATGGLQFLDHSSDAGLKDIEGGFQNAAGNLTFDARITDGIDVYAELYLSSPNHVGDVFDREGYMYIDYLPEMFGETVNGIFKHIDLKVGHMELNFGDQRYFRSDVAQNLNNPLFGNYIVDANTIGVGAELYGFYGPLTAMVGISSGATTGDFTDGRRNAVLGKLAFGELNSPIRLSGSFYKVNQSRNAPGFPFDGSNSNLFSGNFSGSRYQAVWEGSPNAGQITLGNGGDVTAFQFDGRVNPSEDLTVSGLLGYMQDDDTNHNTVNPDFGRTGDDGNPTESWTYFGGTAQYYLADPFYLAFRYNAASANTLGTPQNEDRDSEGIVQRIQVGFGLWIVPDKFLFKVEGVRQWANDFESGAKRLRGLDLATEPRFSGVAAEAVISF
mgnify:CR=1 FL=1